MSRTALVTGTAQGIGRAIARELAAAGVRVVGVDIKHHTSGSIDEMILADLSLVDECLRVVSEAGPVEILVNNAATLVQEPLETFGMADYDRVMAVNLRASCWVGSWVRSWQSGDGAGSSTYPASAPARVVWRTRRCTRLRRPV